MKYWLRINIYRHISICQLVCLQTVLLYEICESVLTIDLGKCGVFNIDKDNTNE